MTESLRGRTGPVRHPATKLKPRGKASCQCSGVWRFCSRDAFHLARASVSPAPPPTNHSPLTHWDPELFLHLLWGFQNGDFWEWVCRLNLPSRPSDTAAQPLSFRNVNPARGPRGFQDQLESFGPRLVWGRRCSAANGGRKYKQLLWSKLWAMWGHCHLQKAGRFVYWTR